MSKKILFSQAILLLIATACVCTDNRKTQARNSLYDSGSAEIAQLDTIATSKKSNQAAISHQEVVTQAIAKIKGYGTHAITGTVTFTQESDGIKIVADVDGLMPGKHGFHVHEMGDCSGEDGMKAGGHFNPTNSQHGGPDSPERHVGDLGNLEADESGHAHYERVDRLIAFEGENSILGRSIIIHADPDDFTTQPTGNSGVRVGCGLIEAVKS